MDDDGTVARHSVPAVDPSLLRELLLLGPQRLDLLHGRVPHEIGPVPRHELRQHHRVRPLVQRHLRHRGGAAGGGGEGWSRRIQRRKAAHCCGRSWASSTAPAPPRSAVCAGATKSAGRKNAHGGVGEKRSSQSGPGKVDNELPRLDTSCPSLPPCQLNPAQ